MLLHHDRHRVFKDRNENTDELRMSLPRYTKKILAPMRHKDECYRSLLTVHGWYDVWDDGTPR
jgi:hypothetical protein